MNTQSLVTNVNTLIDDSIPTEAIIGWLNDGIDAINIEVGANFPYIQNTTAEYVGFPVKWQRTLLIPFATGRAKQQDSSSFEWQQAYGEFYANLDKFREKYTIPIMYRDMDEKNVTYIEGDSFTHPPFGSFEHGSYDPFSGMSDGDPLEVN